MISPNREGPLSRLQAFPLLVGHIWVWVGWGARGVKRKGNMEKQEPSGLFDMLPKEPAGYTPTLWPLRFLKC